MFTNLENFLEGVNEVSVVTRLRFRLPLLLPLSLPLPPPLPLSLYLLKGTEGKFIYKLQKYCNEKIYVKDRWITNFQYAVLISAVEIVNYVLQVIPMKKLKKSFSCGSQRYNLLYLCSDADLFNLLYPLLITNKRFTFNPLVYLEFNRTISDSMIKVFLDKNLNIDGTYHGQSFLSSLTTTELDCRISQEVVSSLILREGVDIRNIDNHSSPGYFFIYWCLRKEFYSVIPHILERGYNPADYNQNHYYSKEYGIKGILKDVISNVCVDISIISLLRSIPVIPDHLRYSYLRFFELYYEPGYTVKNFVYYIENKITGKQTVKDKIKDITLLILNLDKYLQTYTINTVYLLGVCLSDNYFVLKNPTGINTTNIVDTINIVNGATNNCKRYLTILSKLPIELQMILVLRTYGSSRDFILSNTKHFDRHLRFILHSTT